MTNREHVIRRILIYGVMIGALLFWAGEHPLSSPIIPLL